MKEILKELDSIVFHDIPVESIKIVSDPEMSAVITFFLYMEELNDYQKKEIAFKKIEELKTGDIILDPESDIEIYSFDYEWKDSFDCKMILLLGFGKPSLEMKIKCKEIEMKTVSNSV